MIGSNKSPQEGKKSSEKSGNLASGGEVKVGYV